MLPRRRVWRLVRMPCVATAALLVATVPARADDGTGAQAPSRPGYWDPSWPRADGSDYALAGVSATAFAVEIAAFQARRAPLRWVDPILFDADARAMLRLSSAHDRDVVNTVSWGLLIAQIAYPVVVDVPYAWARHGGALARELFWQDAETLFFAGAVDLALRDLVGRARPPVYACLRQGRSDCLDSPETVRSFPGGHFLNATAASVLICTQHLYVHIYGGAWDGLACATTLASNVTVGVMRIMADSHWASDEIAGASLGALIGWGVPYLLHYRSRRAPSPSDRPPSALVLPIPIAVERGGGVGVAGIF